MRSFLFTVSVLLGADFLSGAVLQPVRVPAAFEYNAGQAPGDVVFLARGPRTTVCLTRGGVRLSTSEGSVGFNFQGAGRHPEIAGVDLQRARSSYFRGADPSQWKTGVPNYRKVRYTEVYPGIDVLFYWRESELEYDFVLHPGADVNSIRLSLTGAGSIQFDQAGNLLFGGAVLRLPAVYQEIAGGRRLIPAGFRKLNPHAVAFRVSSYDHSTPLVIDPVLAYSTHLGGGSAGDTTAVYGIAADSAGNAYVTGFTAALDFPQRNSLQSKFGGPNGDVFISKISADGSTLLYSTYLGGSNSDQGNAIAVDSSGNAYVTGVTASADFPAVSPLQAFLHAPNASGGTGFVARISPDGSKLLFSSWLGGTVSENPSSIAVDFSGAPYITGVTYSSDFPIRNAFQSAPASGNTGMGHGFVTKIQPNGSSLVYSTYLGGSAPDRGMGIAVDASGAAYITGYTQSRDFPVKNAYQPLPASIADPYTGYPPTAFVTKLSPNGSSLVYSSFVGGRVEDGGISIAVDAVGSAYVLGRTASPDFPVRNAFQSSLPGTHAFVTKFNPDGSTLAWSTYLGGPGGSELNWSNGALIYNAPGAIAVDLSGHAWVAGGTNAPDFPVSEDAFQPRRGAGAFSSAFVSEFSADGSSLIYSTYLGGPSLDSAFALALDPAGSVYLGGRGGPGFPTMNPLSGGLDGGAFVAKLASGASSPAMPRISGVRNVDGAVGIAPGSWIVISGTGLSSTTRDWTGEIGGAGELPTQLAATTVTVNGKPAYISYVSPTQINAIAPDDGTVGPVPVVVAVNGLPGPPFTAQLNRISPALFLWPQNYAVATHLDYSLAVKNGVFPAISTTGAKPGETIVLWGTGLGPVNPPSPAGTVTRATGFLATPVTVQFGDISQPALAAATTVGNAAVYQVAVTVPTALAAGDYSIGLGVDGAVVPVGMLTIAQP